MKLTAKGSVVILPSPGGYVFRCSLFCICALQKSQVETSLSEFHLTCYPLSNLPGPANSQRLGKDYLGEDKGSLIVVAPVDNTPPLHGQYCCEPASQRSWQRSVPAGRLYSQTAPTMLPHSVIKASSVQVRPVVVMKEVSIDSLQ